MKYTVICECGATFRPTPDKLYWLEFYCPTCNTKYGLKAKDYQAQKRTGLTELKELFKDYIFGQRSAGARLKDLSAAKQTFIQSLKGRRLVK